MRIDLRVPRPPRSWWIRPSKPLACIIDIVVNNAGACRNADFLVLTDDDWADGFALKFFGAMRLTRCAWPYLKAQSGSVVHIAGIGGRTPGRAFSIGGSVNAALLSFTKALADLGIADGVQVNAINPGALRTDRLRARLAKLGDPATAERKFVEAARHPLASANRKTSRNSSPISSVPPAGSSTGR